MRTQQHVIDTRAVKITLSAFPDKWVLRDMTERDYGIDLTLEIFAEAGQNKFGDQYEATGATCHLQIKGTKKELVVGADGAINFRIKKKALFYAEKFSSPFFLIRTCTTRADGSIYFLWIQRYIRDVLDMQQPSWRIDPNGTVEVKIPGQNSNGILESKMASIAFRPKYIEELAEFAETYQTIIWALDATEAECYSLDTAQHQWLLHKARRLRNLVVLLNRNDCCIDERSVDSLIAHLTNLKGNLSEFPDRENFDLLKISLTGMFSSEEFIAENEGDVAY